MEKEAEICHMIEAAEAGAIILRDRQLREMSNKGGSHFLLLRATQLTIGSRDEEEITSFIIRNWEPAEA